VYLLSQSTLRDPEQLTQLFTAFRAFAAAEIQDTVKREKENKFICQR